MWRDMGRVCDRIAFDRNGNVGIHLTDNTTYLSITTQWWPKWADRA